MIVTVYLMVVTLERCRSEKRYNFVYCLAALFFYNLGYFIEMTCGSLEAGIIAIKVMYAGSCFLSPFFFFFVADYCEIRVPKPVYKIPLLLIPAFNYGLVFTLERHSLIYNSYKYDPENPFLGMQIQPGGNLYYLNTLVSMFCITLTCLILIGRIIKSRRGRLTMALLMISALLPVIAHFAYIGIFFFVEDRLSGINLTPFTMVISNMICYFNILRNDMFDMAPRAYSITLDLIRDAFVVLDKDMYYISSNKNAQVLFPSLPLLPKGAPLSQVENWPSEFSLTEGGGGNAREREFTLPHMRNKVYSGWENRVAGEDGRTLGWVILIQDVTETVKLIKNIQAQRDELTAMRDNLKEGIFLMDREYRIQGEYSRALEDVLSCRNLGGRAFTGLLSKSYSPKEIALIADYFNMVFDGAQDAETLEDMNPLKEFSYTSVETGVNKTLRGLFAPVNQGNGETLILGTFQDISAEMALKKQLAEEELRRQDEMRNLFEVMQVDPKVFDDFIEDADYEFDRINTALQKRDLSNSDMLVSVYQSLHAIKSNALIVGLSSYGERLHSLETEIKELRKKENPSFNEILHITMELEKLMEDKQQFPEILKRINDFSAAGMETVKRKEAVFIETLTRACQRAASSEGKKVLLKVDALEIETLLSDRRREVKEILTQLIRNAVCHGVEYPEERKSKGKDETGIIRLSVTTGNGQIRITLKDDGQGLDFDRIAQKAEERGLLKNPGDKTNTRFLSNVIFSPGFSTAEVENLHAGRGIGLNLVRDRVKELGGKIRLRSEKDRGLNFDIQLPFENTGGGPHETKRN
jgi:two-component system chemotaxis sensor kinase CheA